MVKAKPLRGGFASLDNRTPSRADSGKQRKGSFAQRHGVVSSDVPEASPTWQLRCAEPLTLRRLPLVLAYLVPSEIGFGCQGRPSGRREAVQP